MNDEKSNDDTLPSGGKKNLLWLWILITVIVVGGGVSVFSYRNEIKEKIWPKRDSVTNDATPAAETTTNSTPNSESKDNPATNLDESKYKEYRNFAIKYLIHYPIEAKIEDIGEPKASNIENADCVKISTDNYYVIIGKAEIAEDSPALCFRTGVGADWGNGPEDSVTAAGMTYTPNGMHTEAASAGYYQDFFMISPVDQRVKIEYGTSVNEKYGTISKAAAKELVHQIVASYNPAE
ncbi:MAG: hypothetical protein WC451_02030 [Patescibacteria group bacterium]